MATIQEQYEIDLGTAIRNQRKGSEVLAHIYALNMQKLRAGTISAEDLAGLLTATDLVAIERYLLNGSLQTARSLIEASTGTYFTSEDKIKILAVIDEGNIKV